MRVLIILGFLVVASSAGDLGYNYGPGLSGAASDTDAATTVVKTVSSSGLLGAAGLVAPAKVASTRGLIGTGGIVASAPVVSIGGMIGSARLVAPAKILTTSGLVGTGGHGSADFVASGKGVTTSGLVGNAGLVAPVLTTGSVVGTVGSGLVGGSNIVGSDLSTIGGGIINAAGSRVITPGSITVIGIDAVDAIPPTVEYNKQVFYFSAPEEEQNEGVVTQQLSNILKKNLQVVFIKAPENNAATNAALQLAKQAIEQRTAIYVLSKENDASQIVGQLAQIQESIPATPEVNIIKYRTQDDLLRAQQVIQAQYNDFGGPSALIDGGIVPVLNYASQYTSGYTTGTLGNVNLVAPAVTTTVVGGGLRGVGSLGGIGLGNIVGGNLGGARYASGLKTSSYLPPALKK